MGWFDEQIKQRKQSDDQLFEEAFVRIADAVLGTKMSSAYQSDEAKASGEIGEILKYYKIKPKEVPDTVKSLDDRLEYLLRPHGIMRRNVELPKGWYRDAIGAMLGRRKDDGSVVALIPRASPVMPIMTPRPPSGSGLQARMKTSLMTRPSASTSPSR